MGSIRVRKETGKLYLDFRYQGKRCREQTELDDTKVNRRRLERLAKRVDAQITAGTFNYAETFPNSPRAKDLAPDIPEPTNSHPTLAEYAEQWFARSEVAWKRSYRHKLREILELHVKPAFGEKVVSDIRKPEVLEFRAQLAKVSHGAQKGLSTSRVNQIVNLLKQILEDAADQFEFNTPFRGYKPLRLPRTEVDPLSLDEVQRFLDALDEAWRPYFIVRFFTGMRTAEVDGLKWDWVNFETREILVRETRVWGEKETPKTDGSTREIQMSDVVYQALETERVRAATKNSPYVFTTRYGYPLTYRNVNNRVWYPTLEKAGLRRRRPYQTRHTAATLWLAAGESPEWIARQMGHSNTRMLFTVYSRYVPNLTRQDGSAMENLLRSRLGDLSTPHTEHNRPTSV